MGLIIKLGSTSFSSISIGGSSLGSIESVQEIVAMGPLSPDPIPGPDGGGSWILRNGFWDDNGEWDDTQIWID